MQVWHEGMIDWIPARNIPEISDVLQPELAPLSNDYYAGRQRNGIDNGQEERVPPLPDDYKSSNLFLIIFCLFICLSCFPGSVLALISYFKSFDIQTLYAMGKYDLMEERVAEVRKFRKWAIWTDIIFGSVCMIAFAAFIFYLVFYFIHETSKLD